MLLLQVERGLRLPLIFQYEISIVSGLTNPSTKFSVFSIKSNAMKKTIILIVLLFSSLAKLIACSCGGAYSFCVTAQHGLAVLEVEVEKKYEANDFTYVRYIDFKVRKTLTSKDSIAYKNLTLMEGYSTCDRFLYNDLEKGDKLVIIYNYIRQDSNATYPVTSLNICSADFLELKNNVVKGHINLQKDFKEQSMPYDQFKKQLNKLCDLQFLDETSIKIYSNLAENQIDIKNEYVTALNFDIFSSAGQQVYQGKIDQEEEISIDFIDFPSTIYFIRFRNEFSQVTIKTAKVR